jgi:muramidase (phage lysozyme)
MWMTRCCTPANGMGARAAAIFIGLAAFGGVAYALTRSARNGPVDGINWGTLQYDFIDAGETIVNNVTAMTQEPEYVAPDLAAMNERAFLAMLRRAEATDRAEDPYRVVMGYGTTLVDLSDHPYNTGEWKGAYFGNPPQLSTAAGAYQFLRRTWDGLRDKLGLPDFGPASQDAAALELIREKGALDDVRAGRFADAVHKVRRVWASLPGAGSGQGERSLESLTAAYVAAGGYLA